MTEHRTFIGEKKNASYGAVPMNKIHMRAISGSVNNPYHEVNDFDPSSADLVTTNEFLTSTSGERSRDRISRYLDHSTFGIVLDIIQAIVANINVTTYIINTYIPETKLPQWLWFTELFCAFWFGCDYLFRGIYLSEHRKDFLFSFRSLITLSVVLPVIPLSFFLEYHTLWYGASNWRFLYPIRFMKWLNEMTAVLNRCHSQMTPVTQFALLSYFQIFAIISIAAGIIQITETSDGQHQTTFDGDWNFFNSFFNSVLVFVTIQTPPADNVLSKVFVGILVIVLIIVVPYQISKILDIGKSYTPYELASFKPSKRAKHIILCGDLTPTRIDHFFREIFHDDHDMVDINVVVLTEEEPSTNMITLLMDPFFEKRTSYIQGSILDVDDAQRASCSKADAIFVLTRRFGQEELMASDHSTLMRVMAAKRMAPNAAIYAQMHLSNHRHLMEDLGIKNVMYFSEVMHSLLGQNCVCPGFSTFIYNLTTTSSEPMSNDTWESCYLSGSSHELYSVTLPPSEVIHGMTFAEVSSLVYSECAGVILFAIVSNTMGSKHKTLLNPGDTYTCSGGETGFVIAKNRREADAVAFLKDTVNAAAAWGTVRNISLLKEKTSKQCQQLLPYDPFSHDDSIHEDGLSLSHRPVTAANVLFSPNRPGSPIRRESKLIDWVIKPNAGLISISEDGKKNPPRVQDAIIERIEDIQDNKSTNCIAPIVVCALSPTFPDHLEYLIGPLRVKAIKIHRPIIFVCLESPTEENYETIYHFRQVYFIAGDPFRPKVLKKAGIHQAYRVVIMSGEGKMDDSGSNELLADASCIALHKTITSLLGPQNAPRVISELINRANVHFISQNLIASDWFPSENNKQIKKRRQRVSSLLPTTTIGTSINRNSNTSMGSNLSTKSFQWNEISTSSIAFSRNFFLSPSFASGLAYSTSLCDSLMINQYFNSMLKSILREFIFASWKDADYLTIPSTPPGTIKEENHFSPTSSIGSSIISPHGIQRSSLFAVELPLDFVGKTFAYVYHYLLSSDAILTLGVYRCRPIEQQTTARIEQQEKERHVPFGFVYVNPLPTDLLTGNDLLYVLSHKQPCWA